MSSCNQEVGFWWYESEQPSQAGTMKFTIITLLQLSDTWLAQGLVNTSLKKSAGLLSCRLLIMALSVMNPLPLQIVSAAKNHVKSQ